ncbi:MAG: hypothetical protein GWN01_11345, partial [Nitrosopumilaceae archaeon]|nr:hypothetical protein [Nitrosopumilaceae archaeon]NIV66191.1 hypothetical protein [Nitrosopumilaceae archaeon]NIX62080.1 hypothetical protein [Nitrosopumilaceae archaeon]
NDSTVAGDFVDDALNNLSSSVGTMQSSYVTSSIGAETISELQSLGTPSNFTIAFVENHSTTGDNGGGTFIWDSAST